MTRFRGPSQPPDRSGVNALRLPQWPPARGPIRPRTASKLLRPMVGASLMIVVLLPFHRAHASIRGVVTDEESGAPLPGAVISLLDLDRSTLADADGRYVLLEVPAGPQHVGVRRVGYAVRTFHALVPRGGTIEINVALRPEPIRMRSVDVRSSVPVRGVDRGGEGTYPDRGVSSAEVRNHPGLSEPDVLHALAGGEVTLRPESPSGVHVRGGASDQVSYQLDGIPIFSPYHSAGTFSAWNPDAIGRLELLTLSRPPVFPEALTGAIAAATRVPGPRLRVQGALSNTQGRGTVDGPLGRSGAGYLVGLRSTFPGLLVRRGEPSHITGEAYDLLTTLSAPWMGGRIQGLGYSTENEIDAAAEPEDAGTSGDASAPNALAWRSRSLGASWTRRVRGIPVLLRGWSANLKAEGAWGRDSLRERLVASRRDEGILATAEVGSGGRATVVGVHAARSRTAYRFEPDSGSAFAARVETPLGAAFVQHERMVGSRVRAELSLVGTVAVRDVHLSPTARLRATPSAALTLSATYARRHQFAQSWRNPESVVSNIFPVDLYVGSGDSGVPVARSDLAIAAVEVHPTAGVRLGAQGYASRFEHVALVAPSSSGPFASAPFEDGSGHTRGLALEVGVSSARVGLLVSYGLQYVRMEYAGTDYAPDHGATHTLEAGVILFPSTTSDLRLTLSNLAGRRATAAVGAFEWEACNLLDGGCEFAGSPQREDSLGATRLPAYVRVDVGFRKHWHLQIAGHDGQVALFGTLTNILGRRNVLTVAVDPVSGERMNVSMRPRSPLVVGFDWRF